MDPFTEKLLERTRARRENLQKKMAERPNTANRQMAKRPREPLADTNSVISEPLIDKVPQVSSKPSPSKRRCSEENVQPAAGGDNQQPIRTPAGTPAMSDPPTDRKPPAGVRSVPSIGKTVVQPQPIERPAAGPVVQPAPIERAAAGPVVQPQPREKSAAGPVVQPQPMESTAAGPVVQPAPLEKTIVPTSGREEPAPSAGGMRSRLQRLAQQRNGWDGEESPDAVEDCGPPVKVQAEVVPAAVGTSSAAGGRRGRLANLAATIGSWEDDLSHVTIPNGRPKETPAAVSKFAVRDATASASAKPSATGHVTVGSTASNKSASSSHQYVCVPLKPGRLDQSGPKAVDVPADKPVPAPHPGPVSSTPHKGSSQEPAVRGPSPKKAVVPSQTSLPKSPVKNADVSSPQKPQLRADPLISTPQEKPIAGTPNVKSFLDRFGERCQERSNPRSPAGGSSSHVTPNTRRVQERLQAAQAASTASADLTQRQKMERESELALIRNRFQKGNSNMWKNKDGAAETNKSQGGKEQPQRPVETEIKPCEPQDEATVPAPDKTHSPKKGTPPGAALVVSPPAYSSSPLKGLTTEAGKKSTEEEEEEVKEIEMNVDNSSAVINELFGGILEQSDDQSDDDGEEEEDEDALNISSMSLLAPLAETVAGVKSPERSMMTSTPAGSFLVQSPTASDGVRRPSKFQRANMIRTGSSSGSSGAEDDPRLPYSIDAYRSTRVKETERPSVKQVIVRKEDVSQRAEEARGSSAISTKHKIKLLTNDLNLQQTVIHQASQALNCCTDEEHGKGTQVEAEAERLLLVATERREALKAELDSLRGGPAAQKKTAAPEGLSASRGSITLHELRLPLKADFVCSTANKPESTKHSFFIMIRAGAESTVATPLASTHRGLSGDTLAFPTKFTMTDVASNFEVDIEVYALVQKREVCNDKKKKLNKSKAMTPKRFLAITKSVQTPVMASPGGPNAVRTSNFILVGSHKINLSSLGKNKFALEKIKYEGSERELLSGMFHTKVPFLCPLEGHIYLKMHCEVGSSKVEEKGFLTMFEDVSGFGAWHRRWCVLSGYCISYWTYPDDEKRKNPMGRINLASCTSERVEAANREFCARPHTFELITVRPQRQDDRETLVSQCQDTMCVTKNWLSADTKDERNLWMSKLNQILVDLRMWQPDACHRPQ